jgi:hypothetical protein
MTKQDKIGKSVEYENYVLMVAYGKLRKQGSLEVMPVNHFVRGSSPCWGANQQSEYVQIGPKPLKNKGFFIAYRPTTCYGIPLNPTHLGVSLGASHFFSNFYSQNTPKYG